VYQIDGRGRCVIASRQKVRVPRLLNHLHSMMNVGCSSGAEASETGYLLIIVYLAIYDSG